jgi:LPS-assembly protein
MHWSGDKTLWDRKANRVELTGHAAVHQPGETLTADYILLDLKSRTLDARGNCVYIASEAIIYGEEMHFSLDTRTGTIVGGRVANDRFTLTGERINKLGPGRFQTHRGSYTTCLDCPQSWTLHGDDVDLEFEGYAYLNNVTGAIKDSPVFWLPYLIVPLKTRRQTGFLFPRFGVTNEGFTYVQPFFWAISRSADMTIGLGDYGGRGRRAEWEGRYVLSGRSGGTANAFYLNDSTFADYQRQLGLPDNPHRWAVNIGQTQELPWGIEQKLRLLEVSDNLYPSKVGDVPGYGEAYIGSDLIFSHATNQVSTYVAGRRFRNLLNSDPDPRAFDPDTVQVFPTAVMTTNEKFWFGSPVATGLALGITNFTRTGEGFDRDPVTPGNPLAPPRPGIDPVRKATRVSVTPSLYTTVRPWGLFSLVPSVEYRAYFYSFHSELPNLRRGYLLAQVDLSTQLERIFETSNPDIPRVKHLIRPILTYSRIPYVNEDPQHPFLQQIGYAEGNEFSGYNFDNNDIVPIDTSRTYSNYFLPLGNSLTIGLTSQLIRRRGKVEAETAAYQRAIEFRTGETINFRELRKDPKDQQPLSRYFATLSYDFDRIGGIFDYTYVPYITINENQRRHVLSASASYVLERSTRQRILAFDRSFSVGYSYNKVGSQTDNLRMGVTYSLSDYILPSLSSSYDLVSRKWLSLDGAIRFQSPSQCWKFEVNGSRYVCARSRPEDTGVCNRIGVDLSLNLTGSGFGGVGDVASAVRK